jgi:hypothetical protein
MKDKSVADFLTDKKEAGRFYVGSADSEDFKYHFVCNLVRYLDCLPDYKYDISTYIKKIKCYIPACNIVTIEIPYHDVLMPLVLACRELDQFCIRTERMAECIKESVEHMPDYAQVKYSEDKFRYFEMIYYMDRCIDQCIRAGIPNMEDTIILYKKKRVKQIMSVCGNNLFDCMMGILKQYVGVRTEQERTETGTHLRCGTSGCGNASKLSNDLPSRLSCESGEIR